MRQQNDKRGGGDCGAAATHLLASSGSRAHPRSRPPHPRRRSPPRTPSFGEARTRRPRWPANKDPFSRLAEVTHTQRTPPNPWSGPGFRACTPTFSRLVPDMTTALKKATTPVSRTFEQGRALRGTSALGRDPVNECCWPVCTLQTLEIARPRSVPRTPTGAGGRCAAAAMRSSGPASATHGRTPPPKVRARGGARAGAARTAVRCKFWSRASSGACHEIVTFLEHRGSILLAPPAWGMRTCVCATNAVDITY